jgi:hypothetical protein
VEEHPALKWDDRLKDICGQRGEVLKEDPSDNTTQVRFAEQRFNAWLPTCVLADVIMEVCSLDELRPAVERNRSLSWKDHLIEACGQRARLCKVDDSDGTSQIEVLGQNSMSGAIMWLPTICLTEVEGSSEDFESEPLESPLKRQRRLPPQLDDEPNVDTFDAIAGCYAEVMSPSVVLEPNAVPGAA